MLSRKGGVPASDAHKEPERKPQASRRAAAVFSAAAVSIALASGCGGPIANVSAEYPVYAPPRPHVRLLDMASMPEASDESFEAFERQLESSDGPARRDALSGIYNVYLGAGRDPYLQGRCFETLLRIAKTDPDPQTACMALAYISRIGLLNRYFTSAQRMQIAGLVISALRSGSPDIRSHAIYAVPELTYQSGAGLSPKEIDSFIEMYRLLAGYSRHVLITTSLESISRNPNLSAEQMSRMRVMLEQGLANPTALSIGRIHLHPDFFQALAVLATNPNSPEWQARRISSQIARFSDYPIPVVRNSARFFLAYIALGDKCADEREMAAGAQLLLKAGTDGNAAGYRSIPESFIIFAGMRRNPAYMRRNAYRMLRAYVEIGGLPQGIPRTRLPERIRLELGLERDHSVRAEAKELLSVIPQP